MQSTVLTYFLLITSSCYARSLTEEDASVVSVYTTLPTTIKTSKPLDVYQQIATNIAERITSPIYRFLGISKNVSEPTTMKTWETIELLDETPAEDEPVELMDNSIDIDRDVEQISVEALNRVTTKPEKIVLYSSYLPVTNEKLSDNTTNSVNGTNSTNSTDTSTTSTRTSTPNHTNNNDDDEHIDFEEVENPRQYGFMKILTILGSMAQLAWGTISSWFT